MAKLLQFSAALCLLSVLSAIDQATAQVPNPAPFSIDRGSSFSASTDRRHPELSISQRSPEAARIVADVRKALDIIRGYHVTGNRLDDGAATKSSINAMLSELDPHSTYFDPAEFSALLGEQDSEYSGTGSTISNFLRDGRIETYVIATHPDSAASKAKLQYGDRLVAVDGVAISGIAADVVRDKVRGPRGTSVRITVERSATGKIETIELKRDRVFQPSIPNFFMVQDGVGYIGLSEGFSHTTSSELDSAVRELHQRGMRSLVLDLRDNGGGILDEAIKVAEKFLQSGSPIISQRGRAFLDNRTWRSANRNHELVPVVLLVNERTASASEVVAGALQDNDRALILGQNTFGKGLVQNVVELPMGSGLTLTTARYYTPSGRSIQRSYAAAGLYDYFKNRAPQTNDKARNLESRTITNRVVYGGRGITPDEITDTEAFNSKRAGLIDPIFFFVRDVIRGKLRVTDGASITSEEQVRQSIIFSGRRFDNDYLNAFRVYARNSGWNISTKTLDDEAVFITEQLQYQLALASFGPETAARFRIESDKEVLKAIEAVPRAARLAESASKIQHSAEYKKPTRSHTGRVKVETGGIRKTVRR
jgi:carboxyl-terminal processing protease